mmetsp:Transcript_33594/g.51696  ORF Transcript_33594/g.51696 Transcript_33594/m.51696 type:complete len:185 (-) Transcript_33594:100-654(-)
MAAPAHNATSFSTTDLNSLLNKRYEIKQHLASSSATKKPDTLNDILSHDLEHSNKVANAADRSNPIIPYSTPTAKPKVSFDEEDFLNPNVAKPKGNPHQVPTFSWSSKPGGYDIQRESVGASSYDDYVRGHFGPLPHAHNQNAGKDMTIGGEFFDWVPITKKKESFAQNHWEYPKRHMAQGEQH